MKRAKERTSQKSRTLKYKQSRKRNKQKLRENRFKIYRKELVIYDKLMIRFYSKIILLNKKTQLKEMRESNKEQFYLKKKPLKTPIGKQLKFKPGELSSSFTIKER